MNSPRARGSRTASRPETDRRRSRGRAVAVEAAITAALGVVLTGCSLGLLELTYGGKLRFGISDVLIAGAAGLVAAAVVRGCVRLHRHWARSVGRITAGAALCALSGVAGALVAFAPGRCPGELLSTGRCGVQEASAWGLVAALAAVVNFGIAGIGIGLFKGVRGVLLDAVAQGWVVVTALNQPRGRHRSAAGERKSGEGGRPDPRAPKGRPTPRRADARRARRERSRARG